MIPRPIANKYREGKLQRTLKRELKGPEIFNVEEFQDNAPRYILLWSANLPEVLTVLLDCIFLVSWGRLWHTYIWFLVWQGLGIKKVLSRLLGLGSKGLGSIVPGLALTNLWCRLVPFGVIVCSLLVGWGDTHLCVISIGWQSMHIQQQAQ